MAETTVAPQAPSLRARRLALAPEVADGVMAVVAGACLVVTVAGAIAGAW